MFKKLIAGELSLSETFWKYGVLGMIFFTIISKISSELLTQKLGRVDIVQYYTKHFSLFHMDSSVIFVTIFNIAAMLLIVLYSFIILIAVWRSASKYDKSPWLSQISRILVVLMIFTGISVNF